MANLYSNVPVNIAAPNQEPTVRAFNNYYSQPLELNDNVLSAMKGFFTSRGFEDTSAESITVIIIQQAKKDGYNPMRILDTLKGLGSVELSALVAEILNYNRFKTSFLGYALQFSPTDEVSRNIIDGRPRPPGLSPIYEVAASSETVNEGSSVTFNISTQNIKDGKVLYWTIAGAGVVPNDFDQLVLSGTITIYSNVASVTLTPSTDRITEGNEEIIFSLRTTSPTGLVVASANVIINDTSRSPVYNVTASNSIVNEGTTATFNISTQNVNNGTVLYWALNGPGITTNDINGQVLSGTATIYSSVASVTLTPSADLTTEGNETATFSLRTTTSTGLVVTSTNITIVDTSREIVDVTVTWNTTQSGMVSGPGGWTFNNNGKTVRFNVQDSANCGGTNEDVQSGVATATIVTSADAYTFIPNLTGLGEAQDVGFEEMSLYLNGTLIRYSTSAGGSLGCAPAIPVVQTVIVPGPYLIPAYTTATFELMFTTRDPYYHVGAYYELGMVFEKYEP